MLVSFKDINQVYQEGAIGFLTEDKLTTLKGDLVTEVRFKIFEVIEVLLISVYRRVQGTGR